MNKKLLIIFFLFTVFLDSKAQTQYFDILDLPMFNAQVKSIDEFISRFNGKEKRDDVEVQYSNRESNILLLFNLARFKSKADTLFIEAQTFAESVVKDKIFINYEDSCWYAKVTCNGNLGGKIIEFNLYLLVQQRGPYMYKWVIANVDGDIFKTSRSLKHKELYISPNDHEQSFISLSRVVNESYRYIDDYTLTGYMPDKLSVFLTLVRSGLLKVNYVSDVEFVFFQVPGYIFSVKLFERESKNAGWLISSVSKYESNEKDEILRTLYHKSDEVKLKKAQFSKSESSEDIISAQKHEVSISLDKVKPDTLTIGEKLIDRFYKLLSLWCETCDGDYQKKISDLCAGKKGKNCFVSDKLMNCFADWMELQPDTAYSIKLYLKGFEILMNNERVQVDVSNIKQVESNDLFYIVTCNMKLLGGTPYNAIEYFYIQKQDDKIVYISSRPLQFSN